VNTFHLLADVCPGIPEAVEIAELKLAHHPALGVPAPALHKLKLEVVVSVVMELKLDNAVHQPDVFGVLGVAVQDLDVVALIQLKIPNPVEIVEPNIDTVSQIALGVRGGLVKMKVYAHQALLKVVDSVEHKSVPHLVSVELVKRMMSLIAMKKMMSVWEQEFIVMHNGMDLLI